MVDRYFAAALAAGALSSTVVFVVGASLLAGQYAGLYAALTVAGFLFALVAVVLLYAVGEMERDERDRRGRS